MKESQKIDAYISNCSQQFHAAHKPVFEHGKWVCPKPVHTLSTGNSRLAMLLDQAQKQATYARMVERGQVPDNLRTERTITSHAT